MLPPSITIEFSPFSLTLINAEPVFTSFLKEIKLEISSLFSCSITRFASGSSPREVKKVISPPALFIAMAWFKPLPPSATFLEKR